ncbi:uncharacterized protein EV154DRAFT_483812 [Mucor mucedo]|uniref:uncharacterized protein n=1 Tax=Mucor mucedo TaxID=29922 RepID=UPI002220896B|nr:uncharacterized protein EV154DRAFT_483812 [Mucor mucedo]KAI7888750.1 hypothetical protein EV154DRAFT_483812 [Mucor mucedo]
MKENYGPREKTGNSTRLSWSVLIETKHNIFVEDIIDIIGTLLTFATAFLLSFTAAQTILRLFNIFIDLVETLQSISYFVFIETKSNILQFCNSSLLSLKHVIEESRFCVNPYNSWSPVIEMLYRRLLAVTKYGESIGLSADIKSTTTGIRVNIRQIVQEI